MSARIPCRLCGEGATLLFERDVLGRPVGYYQCGACGLTQTQEPTWLPEAYAKPIHSADTGLLARNLRSRRIAACFLHLCGVRAENGLDYAGGYGLFVRLMRDVGFSFYWSDPYATNLFAQGFEWRPGLAAPRVVTAFEVLEHWVRPLEEFRAIAALGAEWIITSTEIHPGPRPDPRWHYLVPESGQHIAFYRADTIARLGRDAGYSHVHVGPFFQILSRRPIPLAQWNAAIRWSALLYPLVRRLRPSLTVPDSEGIRAKIAPP